MGKLYNFVMVRCTTLLEKFFRRPIDLEMNLLDGGNGGLPSAPKSNFWQKPAAATRPVSGSAQQHRPEPHVNATASVESHQPAAHGRARVASPSPRDDGAEFQQCSDRADRTLTIMAWLTPVSGPPHSPATGAPPTGRGGVAPELRSVAARRRRGRDRPDHAGSGQSAELVVDAHVARDGDADAVSWCPGKGLGVAVTDPLRNNPSSHVSSNFKHSNFAMLHHLRS